MSHKIVYQIDLAGLFMGSVSADPSPLEPGIFLIPAGCVELAPPINWPDDQWPRWNGFKWELIQKPKVQQATSPEQKLADFLAQNPDVLQLIQNK